MSSSNVAERTALRSFVDQVLDTNGGAAQEAEREELAEPCWKEIADGFELSAEERGRLNDLRRSRYFAFSVEHLIYRLASPLDDRGEVIDQDRGSVR